MLFPVQNYCMAQDCLQGKCYDGHTVNRKRSIGVMRHPPPSKDSDRGWQIKQSVWCWWYYIDLAWQWWSRHWLCVRVTEHDKLHAQKEYIKRAMGLLPLHLHCVIENLTLNNASVTLRDCTAYLSSQQCQWRGSVWKHVVNIVWMKLLSG